MNANPSSAATETSGRAIGLPGAFVWSVVLHAVALVLIWLLGLTDALTRPVESREAEEIAFTLAETEPVEEPEALPQELAETDEAPAEPAVRSVPLPPPEGTPAVEPEPLPPSAEPRPAPAETFEEAVPSEPVQAEETFDPAEPELEIDENPGESGAPFPETTRGARPPQTPGGRQPSLDERLQDFGRAIARFKEQNPPVKDDRSRDVFEPDWGSLPTTGTALGNLRFESSDFDWEDYGRQIYWIIWRTWHNRLLDRVDDFERWAQREGIGYLNHVNGVRFTIERSGEISEILLETPSGCIPFDLSATEALDEAVLPPLPAEFHRDREVVHAMFLGDGPVGQMRPVLRHFKAIGLF